MSEPELLLAGLDGSNPLAYLAALGTLRTLSLALPNETVAMSWLPHAGGWAPYLRCSLATDTDKLIDTLHRQLKISANRPAFCIGDNLNLPSGDFHKILLDITADPSSFGHSVARDGVDFLAAYGTDAIADNNGIMQDTALRTMSGAGHQHLLKFFRDISAKTEASHLARALLFPWDYLDDGRGLSLRWDPAEDRRYALRWDNPSGDPVKTMRGANRLAIEAIPFLPTVPTQSGLSTTCFHGTGRRGTFFVWPLWFPFIGINVVQSLLGQATRLKDDPSLRSAYGVAAMFSSARITTGKFRNMSPAEAI